MNPIKAARLGAGYQTANAARKDLGIDQGCYCRLENGKQGLSLTMLTKLTKAYGVTAGQLLGLEPLPTAPSTQATA